MGSTPAQMDDTAAPTTAKDTMPEAGMAAAFSPKCFIASTYASVGLLLSVSTTKVLRDASSILTFSPPRKDRAQAAMPPRIGNAYDARTAARYSLLSKTLDANAQFDAPPATKTNVARTPTSGQTDSILRTKDGRHFPKPNPSISGIRTSCRTDFRTPVQSTVTTQFKKTLASSGMATVPNSVVDRVHATDSATSPPASNEKRLLAWPPDTHPSNISPALFSRPKLKRDATRTAITGIIPKQRRTLSTMTDGFWMARDMSAGVMARPIASMRTDRDVCITDRDPITGPMAGACLVDIPAESSVQSGDSLQKLLETSENEKLLLLPRSLISTFAE